MSIIKNFKYALIGLGHILKSERNARIHLAVAVVVSIAALVLDLPAAEMVAIFFAIRSGKVNAHVFMRSSDVWLGVPYDVFNFSMLGHLVCSLLNEHRPPVDYISPGTLFLTAASSHLYEVNWDDAKLCLAAEVLDQPETPKLLWTDAQHLMAELMALRDTRAGDERRWWER